MWRSLCHLRRMRLPITRRGPGRLVFVIMKARSMSMYVRRMKACLSSPAKNPAGPWRMHHGANETGWIDPTVQFDDDGPVYLVPSLGEKPGGDLLSPVSAPHECGRHEGHRRRHRDIQSGRQASNHRRPETL